MILAPFFKDFRAKAYTVHFVLLFLDFFSHLLMKNRLLHILYKKKQFSMKSAYLDLQVSMEIFTREKISSEPLSKPIFEDDFLK